MKTYGNSKITKFMVFAFFALTALVITVAIFPHPASAGIALANFPAMSGTNPAEKIAGIGDKFGLKQLKNNQGTSRTIYDTLPVVLGQEFYPFFRECNTRTFPQTNMTKGNKLEVGEALSILWGYINLYKYNTVTGAVTVMGTQNAAGGGIPAFGNVQLGEFSFMLGNSQVIKPIRLMEWTAWFNKRTQHLFNEVYTFNSMIVIPELLEFEAQIRVMPFIAAQIPAPETNEKLYIQLSLEGLGAILSPKATF
jgi:hypothetical protein